MKIKREFIAGQWRNVDAESYSVTDRLRTAMEVENRRWLSAFNTQDVEKVRATYTDDAVLIPPGAPAANGPDAIGAFWEVRMNSGVRDHTFSIVETYADGQFAYQVAKWTAIVAKEGGEKLPLSGSNLRVFEQQSDSTWKVKAHIFVRD